MKQIMKLTEVSPLMSRSFQDKQTGADVTINWVELTLTDGVDTFVGELIVPKTKDDQGNQVVRQPEFTIDALYGVSFEIEGARGTTSDGKPWNRNRMNIKKIGML